MTNFTITLFFKKTNYIKAVSIDISCFGLFLFVVLSLIEILCEIVVTGVSFSKIVLSSSFGS